MRECLHWADREDGILPNARTFRASGLINPESGVSYLRATSNEDFRR
ncbi:MAG: hypothetical protein AAGG44_06470 [Planctomycetota bacterium]